MSVRSQTSLGVVGGGVIGLSGALAAADAGWQVTVYDQGTAERAAHVAAGMLGSLGEGHPGEDALLELSRRSVARWPDYLHRLADPAIRVARDSLFVATSAADSRYLDQLAEFVWSADLGDRLRPVTATEIRGLEDGLGARLRGGYLALGEAAVDNRRLLDTLALRLTEVGGVIRTATITAPDELPHDRLLLAAGPGMVPLLPSAGLHLAKGEVLRLQTTRWSVPPPDRVVRARVDGRTVYLVPRSDGVVVGATQYEADHSPGEPVLPEAGGVADLLADALEVMPGLRTYRLVEASAGLRPCTADGLPIVERIDERTVVAAGHGRNGILLAPETAATVRDLLGPPDRPRHGGPEDTARSNHRITTSTTTTTTTTTRGRS